MSKSLQQRAQHHKHRFNFLSSSLRHLWLLVGACLVFSACAGLRRAAPETPTVSEPAETQSPIQLRTFEKIWSTIDETYIYHDLLGESWQAVQEAGKQRLKTGTSDEAFVEVVKSMLAEVPAGGAVWQSRSERIQQDIEDTSSYEGIGAFVSFRAEPEPRIVLLSVISGSPAEAAGLKAHDSILAIDALPVGAEEGLEAVRRIRGPSGSQVILLVRSPGGSPREVIVSRQRLVARDQIYYKLIPKTNLGYIHFPPIAYSSLEEEFLAALQELIASTESQLDGLVLDLRISGTGENWPVMVLFAIFTDGELGEIFTRTDTNQIAVEGQDILGSQTLPLAVLVGPDTRGTPEIFAAALQATGRATVIGLTTPGNVEAVSSTLLPDGSQLFVSTSSFRTPDGHNVGLEGVQPSRVVDADWDHVSDQNDLVLQEAVNHLTGGG